MDNESTRVFIFVPLGIGLVGLVFSIIGIMRLRNERAFARSAAQASGVVVGFQRRRLSRRSSSRLRSRVYDFPVVRYTTQTGQRIEFASRTATQPRVVREGEAVTVLYDPAVPQQARIASGCLQYGCRFSSSVSGWRWPSSPRSSACSPGCLSDNCRVRKGDGPLPRPLPYRGGVTHQQISGRRRREAAPSVLRPHQPPPPPNEAPLSLQGRGRGTGFTPTPTTHHRPLNEAPLPASGRGWGRGLPPFTARGPR